MAAAKKTETKALGPDEAIEPDQLVEHYETILADQRKATDAALRDLAEQNESLRKSLSAKHEASPTLAAEKAARIKAQHEAGELRDALAAADEQLARLRAENDDLRRQSGKGNTLVALGELPPGTLRLLAGVVIETAEGARVYPKRGDVLAKDNATAEAARSIVGSRAKVYTCRPQWAHDLVTSGMAEVSG